MAMPPTASERGSVTAELALALPTVTLILAVALGSFGLQIEKMKLVSIAGVVARGIARGEAESAMMRLANELRQGTSIDLKFEPTKVCAKAFFVVQFDALGGQQIEVADWQCARSSGL